MPTKIEKDAISGRETTGHDWDGIKELNTPLPKWWVYVFYATIVWSIGYWVVYPSWPTLSTHLHGAAGYWSRAELLKEVAQQAAERAPYVKRIGATSLEDVQKDPDLYNFALAGGRAAFGENCAACHGPGGGGTKGFPNLADDDWLWGGDRASILRTVSFGVRNANPESRQSQMPRFGADGILKPDQINDVAEYVLSLSGTSTDAAAARRGAQLFAENCAVCHGEKGTGNKEVGAPNLTDRIWLYGGDKATVVQTITFSRGGSMPAWSERLDPATVKMLALYVHSLGGGQ
ncbi:MAG TPA: cytochrome-c oxidase, cbb3-type subunit III [Alphaproteobacteria bacterium]|nr:cytochrome-c oxidase, cbb3-type subunit III [Alphaproteobacteria bacterium]